MSQNLLPEPFKALEPFVAWALPTMDQRVDKRITSPYTEAKAFYDAIFPRIEEVLAYLDRLPLDALPDDARRLGDMALSMVEVSIAVEVFQQVTVPHGATHDRFRVNAAVSGGW